MNVLVNVLGVEVILKKNVVIEPRTPAVGEVVRCLRGQIGEAVERFLTADCTTNDCSAILINGRNILSLNGWDTTVKEGDEITFLVPVGGG